MSYAEFLTWKSPMKEHNNLAIYTRRIAAADFFQTFISTIV